MLRVIQTMSAEYFGHIFKELYRKANFQDDSRLLTVNNDYNIPSSKLRNGYNSTSNIEIGFTLTEFYRFW